LVYDRNNKPVTLDKNFQHYFLRVGFFTAGVLLVALTVLFALEKEARLARTSSEEQANLDQQEKLVVKTFETITSDLKILASQNELEMFLASADNHSRELAEKEYLSFIRHKGLYDQIRYLDEHGMEIFRVNYNAGNPFIVPRKQLQNKKQHPYFSKTMALKKGEIYVSPFDLNFEQGEVEVPFKPVIRFATPIVDDQMGKRGIVILNYLGAALIETLRESGRISSGNTLLLNADGFWLCAIDPNDEWGFVLRERKNCNFASEFPAEWKKISQDDFVQFVNLNGMFTSRTIFPLLEARKNKKGESQPENQNPEMRDRHWKLVSYITFKALHEANSVLLKELLWVGVILLFSSLVPVWMIAKRLVRRQTSQEELFYSANYDEVTGLLKRTPFVEKLGDTYEESRRYQRNFALLFIDLDDFKSINDNYGHDAGDKVLKETSRRLVASIRQSDTVSRMGGDEFAVLLSLIEQPLDVKVVAEKIIEKLSAPYFISNRTVQLGVSIGICHYPEHKDAPDILLKKADAAMYEAKRAGKNTYRLAS
jgi:diguanylate cyclase (GGDEF)-like protein